MNLSQIICISTIYGLIMDPCNGQSPVGLLAQLVEHIAVVSVSPFQAFLSLLLKVAQTGFNTFKKLTHWNDLCYHTVSRISNVVVPYETAIIAE